MPPAPGAPAAAAFLSSSLMSAMRASVVRHQAAMDAAFCSARRVTLAGSMMPHLDHVAVLAVSALKPKFSSLESRILPITTAPSWPALESDLAGGLFESAPHDAAPTASSSWSLRLFDDRDATEQAPSLRRGQFLPRSCAGGMHSVFDTRLLFFQFGFGGCANLDDGDAPDSLARRSWSFSLS